MSIIEILQVNLITKEDYKTLRPFQFNPNVVKFFTTTTYLDKKILVANNIEIKPSLFLNHQLFDKAIKILKETDKKNHTADEIIKNNIDLFRDALFSKKSQIPIGSKKYFIINSTYVPNTFKMSKQLQMQNGNVMHYTITFELSVLDAQRDLKEGDFSRANCKLNARELNNQAKALFGISLGLDGDFPPLKNTTSNGMYNPNPGMYNPNPGMYNPNPGMYNPGMYNPGMYNPNSIKNDEIMRRRKDIREWLRDYEKKKDIERKDKNINDWQFYRQSQLNQGLPVISMNEWINKRVQDKLENKYKMDWLDYKSRQESLGKTAVYDKWLKDKLEEDLENKVELYMNEWIAYKSDQALLGKIPNLNDWLKERVKNRGVYVGGLRKSNMHKRSKHKRSNNKRSNNKRSKHKRSKHKRSKHKRSKYTKRKNK